MTTNRNIEEVIVQIRPDTALTRKTQAEIEKVRGSIRSLGTSTDQELDRRFKRSVRSASTEVRALNQELQKVDKSVGLIGGRGSRLQVLGRQAKVNLPALPIPGTGLSTESISRLVELFGLLPTAILPATAAIAGLGIAVAVAKSNFDQAKASIEKDIEARRRLNALRVEGTTKEIEAELKALEIRKQIATLNLQEEARRLGVTAEAVAAGTDFGNTLQFLGASFGLAESELAANIEAAGKSKKELEDLNREIGVYNQALGLSEVRTRSAAEAEKELAEERAKNADEAVFNQLELIKKFATEVDTGVIDKLIRQRLNEKEAIAATIENAKLSEEGLAALKEEFVEVSSEISTLALLIRPEVAEREKEAEAVKKVTDLFGGLGKSIKSFFGDVEKVQEAGRKIQDLREDFSDKLADIERRRTEKIEDAELDLTDKLSEIRRDAGNDVVEAERETKLETLKLERDTRREIRKIRVRSLFDEKRALQERDALTLEAVRARRDEEIQETKDGAEERKQEIADNLKEQRRTIDRALKEQTRLAHLRYSQQVRDAGIAARRSIEVEREKFKAEEQIRIAAYRQALGIEITGETERNRIAAEGVGQRFAAEASFVQASINLWNNAKAAIFGGPTSSSSVNIRPPSVRSRSGPLEFHQGGVMPYDGLAVLKRGEVVTNPALGQRPPGGMTLNINFSGATVRTIQTTSRQETLRQLNEFLVGMGAA